MDGALLQFIIAACKDNDCAVFSAEDFLLEHENGWDESSLRYAVERLADGGYLCVKYAEGGMYCVRLSPKGRNYSLREKERLIERFCERERTKKAAFCGGLIGGAIGAFVVFLLTLLFR